jgi:uncharacterized protein YdeI (YjbR/CyaY-like superfamily)
MDPTFFETSKLWRTWLAAHHENAKELLVGFYKVGSGRASITPKKPRSIWSAVNVARVKNLTEQGLMQPAGLQAFAAREESRTAVYAFEQANVSFDSVPLERFQANSAAWQQFQARVPWFRRRAIWRMSSAKQSTTRERRLLELIAEHCEQTSE